MGGSTFDSGEFGKCPRKVEREPCVENSYRPQAYQNTKVENWSDGKVDTKTKFSFQRCDVQGDLFSSGFVPGLQFGVSKSRTM